MRLDGISLILVLFSAFSLGIVAYLWLGSISTAHTFPGSTAEADMRGCFHYGSLLFIGLNIFLWLLYLGRLQ